MLSPTDCPPKENVRALRAPCRLDGTLVERRTRRAWIPRASGRTGSAREMKYRSTLHGSPEVSLREAVLHGSAPDGGLYMPVDIPHMKEDFLERLPSLTFPEIALDISALFSGSEIPPQVLMKI